MVATLPVRSAVSKPRLLFPTPGSGVIEFLSVNLEKCG